MKRFMIVGIFFQVGRKMPQTSGICGALYAQYQDKVISSDFLGAIDWDPIDGQFKGEMRDKYGPAEIMGTMKKEEDSMIMNFRKVYEQSNGTANYQLTKKGEVYFGNFQVEGYGKESEGWVKCYLIPVEVDFFQPTEFMTEIDTEIERRKSL